MVVLAGIMFLVLFAVGLIFMLNHFMQKNVTGAVGHLQKLNDELMKQQADLRQKIAEADKEYQTKMTKVQQEVTAMHTQAKQEVTKTIEEARARAQSEREKLINEAIETKEKIRQEIMADMDEKAIQHAKHVIQEFFSGDMKKMVHQALIDELIEGLETMDFSSFQIQTDIAELRSGEEVSDASKEKIRKVLEKKINRKVQFKDEKDASLAGGVILKFGTFVIDASLSNRLMEAAASLKKETVRKYQGKT